MYTQKIIAIDHGNGNVKTKNFIIPSGLIESFVQPPVGDFLQLDNKYYTLEGRIPYMRDKTKDERFFILTLYAIGMELSLESGYDKGIIQIDLPIGLPPKHYGALYQSFESYFKRNQLIEFEYKRKNYTICIRDVMAFPQSYAASMTIFSTIKSYLKTYLIDIGGYTVDYLLLRDGKPDLTFCDSLEKGILTLFNKIKSRINSEYDLLLDDYDIMHILSPNSNSDCSEEIQLSIRQMTYSFSEDLLNMLRELGIDLKGAFVVFIGGGALLLQSYLQQSEKVGKTLFIEDIKANAIGYEHLYRLRKGSNIE